MVDFSAIASKPELMGCTSCRAWRKVFHGTMVLPREKRQSWDIVLSSLEKTICNCDCLASLSLLFPFHVQLTQDERLILLQPAQLIGRCNMPDTSAHYSVWIGMCCYYSPPLHAPVLPETTQSSRPSCRPKEQHSSQRPSPFDRISLTNWQENCGAWSFSIIITHGHR